jgi:hypothetical protein
VYQKTALSFSHGLIIHRNMHCYKNCLSCTLYYSGICGLPELRLLLVPLAQPVQLVFRGADLERDEDRHLSLHDLRWGIRDNVCCKGALLLLRKRVLLEDLEGSRRSDILDKFSQNIETVQRNPKPRQTLYMQRVE